MTEENLQLAWQLLPLAVWETFYMVFVAAFFALLIGFPLGVVLFITGRGKLKESAKVHKILGTAVNIGRSFPFAILLIALIPFTRFIIGTSLGTTASIVPLAVAAAPYLARVVETALQGVSENLLDAAIVMGSSPWQVIRKILIVEAYPALILNFTVVIVNLVGYSAMAGLVGGGGLGTVAIQYGYQRFNGFLMFWTVVLLILIVQLIQWLGNKWANAVVTKRGLS